MKKTYKIDVDCANCANKMEDAARRTEGVQSCTVNFMTLKMNEIGRASCRENCKKVEDDCEVFL